MLKNYLRSKTTGQFISKKPTTIVSGRLYGWQGLIVRAGQITPSGLRFVTAHKRLTGYVDDSELYRVSSSEVQNYLAAGKTV